MNQSKLKKQAERESGIELLKIVAIFLIVISHVVQTLTTNNVDISYQNYVIDIEKATTNISNIILLIFRHFGIWGNSLFFIASSWFLLKNTTYKKEKCFFMILEIMVVSILILCMTNGILQMSGGIKISAKIVIKSIFPTLFGNNWYMTCYLIFYPLSPFLNEIINKMSQTQLFRSSFCLTVMYLFLGLISGFFFTSRLIVWVAIYFLIAYIQRYDMEFANNKKNNIILFVFNAFCLVGLILVTEIAGLRIDFFEDKMTYWMNNCNPFIIFMSIGMFNLARHVHFTNRFVNYISSLSLLIYIIHENIILRTYFRPAMWNYVYIKYGYSNMFAWIFIFVILIFLSSIIIAVIYSATIQKLVKKISNQLYTLLRKKYLSLEKQIVGNVGHCEEKNENQ